MQALLLREKYIRKIRIFRIYFMTIFGLIWSALTSKIYLIATLLTSTKYYINEPGWSSRLKLKILKMMIVIDYFTKENCR